MRVATSRQKNDNAISSYDLPAVALKGVKVYRVALVKNQPEKLMFSSC